MDSPKIKLKKSALPYSKELEKLAREYEKLEGQRLLLRNRHAGVFAKDEELSDEMELLRERMKKHVSPFKEKPSEIANGKTAVVYRGTFYNVKVTHKQQGAYYEVSALPKKVLTMPGVVKDVDRVTVDGILELTKDNSLKEEILAAKREGIWTNPAVTIERADAEDQEEAEG